jgi:hypothetical protein
VAFRCLVKGHARIKICEGPPERKTFVEHGGAAFDFLHEERERIYKCLWEESKAQAESAHRGYEVTSRVDLGRYDLNWRRLPGGGKLQAEKKPYLQHRYHQHRASAHQREQASTSIGGYRAIPAKSTPVPLPGYKHSHRESACNDREREQCREFSQNSGPDHHTCTNEPHWCAMNHTEPSQTDGCEKSERHDDVGRRQA